MTTKALLALLLIAPLADAAGTVFVVPAGSTLEDTTAPDGWDVTVTLDGADQLVAFTGPGPAVVSVRVMSGNESVLQARHIPKDVSVDGLVTLEQFDDVLAKLADLEGLLPEDQSAVILQAILELESAFPQLPEDRSEETLLRIQEHEAKALARHKQDMENELREDEVDGETGTWWITTALQLAMLGYLIANKRSGSGGLLPRRPAAPVDDASESQERSLDGL